MGLTAISGSENVVRYNSKGKSVAIQYHNIEIVVDTGICIDDVDYGTSAGKIHTPWVSEQLRRYGHSRIRCSMNIP